MARIVIGYTSHKSGKVIDFWFAEAAFAKALGLAEVVTLDLRGGRSADAPQAAVYGKSVDGLSVSIASLWAEDGLQGLINAARVDGEGRQYSNAQALLQFLKTPKMAAELLELEDRWVLVGYPVVRPEAPVLD